MLHYNVRGVRRVRRKLTNELHEMKDKTTVGVWEAGLMIQREAQSKTPVVTGNLKSSAYTERWDSMMGPAVEVGYLALYAHKVHESPNAGQLGHLNPPDGPQVYSYVGEPKFLEHAVFERMDDVLEVIKRRAGV